MTRARWHIHQTADSYTLARHWPPRFDVQATSVFPPLRADKLARQVRQDMWRALQSLRGFSPVVKIQNELHGTMVTAGGRVAGRVPPGTDQQIKAILDDPRLRARWSNWAGKSVE